MNATRILVLDDEPGVLLALKLLLQALRFEVIDFNCPRRAVDYLTNNSDFDLVISDLKMPGLTGLQVLERVKALKPSIPFILMSGHAQQPDIDKALSQGADGFLPKPFSTTELREVLQLVGVGTIVEFAVG